MFDYLEKNSSALIQRWLTTTDSYYIQMRTHTHTHKILTYHLLIETTVNQNKLRWTTKLAKQDIQLRYLLNISYLTEI